MVRFVQAALIVAIAAVLGGCSDNSSQLEELRGNRDLVSSIGCKNRKHKFTGKLTFGQRADGAAVPAPVSLATSAPCTK